MTARSAFILWFATALSVVGFIAGFNLVVDPFGYFGRNTIGFYFSSERQFKYSLVKSYDYNAIVLGDSRIALTDTSAIEPHGEYVFVNGGVAKAWLGEQVALLSASRLDRLKLAILGLRYRDFARCAPADAIADEAKQAGAAPVLHASWDVLRYSASLSQFAYSIKAVVSRARGKSSGYHADGMRAVAQMFFGEAVQRGRKSEDYWAKVKQEAVEEKQLAPPEHLAATCREPLATARALADRHGFALVVVILPLNNDVLERLDLQTPEAQERIGRLLAEVQKIVPNVVDLSSSRFSDSGNFYSDDPTHFKPLIGALVVQEAISRSLGTQASK